ncbi:helix-turn-helix transcriptional regulator [Microbacterium halotolerans]|uniref:helix-turn-helix transcriptional regulator n=1 Tax=Microbacterium halotolerans TaxID=246613 RepID=UPI0013C2CC79|nr:LuxR C-terminal-related transcriptional regulator [Microbacterium halotolerans]
MTAQGQRSQPVALSGEARLVVIRAESGRGKTALLREWTSTLTSDAVVWPVAVPAPRTATSLWMRAITQLHAQALISDEMLFRTTAEASASAAAVRDALCEVLASLPYDFVIVIDGVDTVATPAVYGQVLADVSHMLRRVRTLRVVVAESVQTAIDDLDAAHVERADVAPEELATWAESAAIGSERSPPARSRQTQRGDKDLRDVITDPAVLADVCMMALPPHVDGQLAAMLTASSRAADLLDRLVDAGLGTWVSDALGSRRFEFRGGPRAQALDMLRRRWPTARGRACRTLARWYMRHGQDELALEYAIDSEDVELIERIALRVFPFSAMLAEETLARVAALGPDRIRDSPLLSVWMGTSVELSPRSGLDGRELFANAIEAAKRPPEGASDTERLIALGIEGYALRRTGDGARARVAAIRFSEQAAVLVESGGFDEALDQAFANFGYQVGVTLIYSEEWRRARQHLNLIERFCSARRIAYRRNSALAALSYLEAYAGDNRESTALAQRIRDEDWPRVWRGGNIRTYYLLSQIVREATRGHVRGLRQAVAEFRTTAPVTEHWDICLLGEILLDLAEGDPSAARARFESVVGERLSGDTHPGIVKRVALVQRILRLAGEQTHALAAPSDENPQDPLQLALDAARDLDGQRIEEAAGKLGRAVSRARAPLEQHVVFAVLARLGVHRSDAESVRDAASRLQLLQRSHQLRIAFALISEDERERILAVADNPSSLRSGFALSPPLPAQWRPRAPTALTPMQLTVLRTLAELGDRREVARSLYLSPGTVKAHLRAIYRKLDAHSQDDAILKASARGLLLVGDTTGRNPRV